VLAYRLLPGLKFAPRLLRRDSLRELGSYGALSFINRMGNQITSYVQALVIGIFMPVEAVTYYVIGANLMPYFENIIGTITLTFTPEATACDARGDRAGLRRLWLLGTRGTTLFVCLIGGGMIFLGRDFLRLWMGDKYLLGYPFASSAAVLTLLTVGALVRNSQTCGLQILFGMRRVRFLAINSSIEAVATLVLSVVLVQRFGLIGVAVASIVPVLVTRGFLMPQYLLRQIHVGVGDYLRQAFQGGVGILLTMGLCSLVLSERMPVANWSQFFLKAAAIAGPAGIVGLLLETLVRRDSLLRLRSRPAAVDQDENVDRTI
jgi:O-antigen/teichoic acid export membrane protein